MRAPAVFRMPERQIGGVEHQPAGWRAAVETVSDNRPSQTGRMGAMDAELVCAARVGNQAEEGFTGLRCFQYFVFRDGGFAMVRIDLLPRAVIPVRGKGKKNLTAAACL